MFVYVTITIRTVLSPREVPAPTSLQSAPSLRNQRSRPCFLALTVAPPPQVLPPVCGHPDPGLCQLVLSVACTFPANSGRETGGSELTGSCPPPPFLGAQGMLLLVRKAVGHSRGDTQSSAKDAQGSQSCHPVSQADLSPSHPR